MFTTGSKLLIGSAVLAWLSAAVYGIAQSGTLGTIGLVSASVALSLLAAINVSIRDSNVSAMDHESFESSAAAPASARASLWPLLTALGVTMITLGLATFPAIFVLGVIATAAGAVEWIVQAWSERASADRTYNNDVRGVMIGPLELPVAAAIGFAVVAFSFSRVMLGLPTKSATVVAFSVVAAIVLAVGVFVAINRNTSKVALTGLFSIGAVALIAGGTIAGLNGEREIHEHDTTADLAESNRCGAEETEADEGASQTVASKSNAAAVLTFTGSELEIDVPGTDGNFDKLFLPRSNATNIMFINESDDHARLVAEMHPAIGDDGQPVGPTRVCSTLVEESGRQFMTVEFDRSSIALEAEGVMYEFVVPGSDAKVEVVVP